MVFWTVVSIHCRTVLINLERIHKKKQCWLELCWWWELAAKYVVLGMKWCKWDWWSCCRGSIVAEDRSSRWTWLEIRLLCCGWRDVVSDGTMNYFRTIGLNSFTLRSSIWKMISWSQSTQQSKSQSTTNKSNTKHTIKHQTHQTHVNTCLSSVPCRDCVWIHY